MNLSPVGMMSRIEGEADACLRYAGPGSARRDNRFPRRFPSVTRLIAVRHGETEWNHARREMGQLDSPLTTRGILQAQAPPRAHFAGTVIAPREAPRKPIAATIEWLWQDVEGTRRLAESAESLSCRHAVAAWQPFVPSNSGA